MSRLSAVFESNAQRQRKALIPFITAGFPDAAATVPLMHALVTGGADVIELGIPFSDPMADGPTIQRASERALAQGMTLTHALTLVRAFRNDDAKTPVVLMGYANPIESFGLAAFAAQAAQAGVDGVLTVDYSPQEAVLYARTLKTAGLAPIFLLAPTSRPERTLEVAQLAAGYIYYVSLKGVTGAAHLDLASVAARIPELQAKVRLPVAVGFGIRDGATAAKIAALADGVIVGSRIIEEIETATLENLPLASCCTRVTDFVRSLRTAMDNPSSL